MKLWQKLDKQSEKINSIEKKLKTRVRMSNCRSIEIEITEYPGVQMQQSNSDYNGIVFDPKDWKKIKDAVDELLDKE